MKAFVQDCNVRSLCAAAAWLVTGLVGLGQSDDHLVGVWVGQGWVETVELLFRSDGRYQIESTTVGAQFGPRVDRGCYQIVGQALRLTSYTYLQTPGAASYDFQLDGDSLSLSGGSDLSEFDLRMNYELKPGSRADVLAREQASDDLVRRWTRHILFEGEEEWTFRPGGYYCLKSTSENVQGFVQFQRGRYESSGTQLTLKPYGGNASQCEVDIFGAILTLISTNSWSGEFNGFEEVLGSAAEVAAKAAEAQAFLSDPDWQAGVWQIQKGDNKIDLLLRPDGIYTATNTTARVHRILRGRYTLAGAEIDLIPFIGQERYALDEADFGMEEQPFTLDYYDGELQLIDHKPGILQSVTLARPSPGSRAPVLELVRQAQSERARDGWQIGLWEANDPTAWMEFTFRPDNCYITKSGAGGVASEVERGQYVVAPGKITLAPFAGNGPARGFELDLATSYDYGFYTADMAAGAVVYDSRLAVVQNQRLDFYGDTMTIYGGTNTTPSTYTVNLGSADAAIATSFADDDAEAQGNAQWVARVPIGPTDPNANPMPDLNVDPHPEQVFAAPTVFSQYQFYRRLIPLLLGAIQNGQMVTVGVIDTQEWHFLSSGRVLLRFRIWSSDGFEVSENVRDEWGAYQIEPKPNQTDILHLYADNGLTVKLDVGDLIEMTLENGRRSLFHEKVHYPLALWANEYKPVACQVLGNSDGSLINTGVSLATAIAPDPTGAPGPFSIAIAGPVAGTFTVSGTTELARSLVLQRVGSLASPITWRALFTNSVPAGPFSFTISETTDTAAFFRLRSQE